MPFYCYLDLHLTLNRYSRNMKPTKDDLIAHAKNFKSRKEWVAACYAMQKQGFPLYFRLAYNHGKEFYRQCVAHMTYRVFTVKKVMPLYASWRVYTAEEIKANALMYQTLRDWKKGDRDFVRAAKAKGEQFYYECRAHMVAAANPYNSPYSIYVFEFIDNHAYVGLSFVPESRYHGHTDDIVRGKSNGGSVYLHIKECGTFTYKIIQTGIIGPWLAGEREEWWKQDYIRRGWIMLNKIKCGGTGGLGSRYTNEDIIEDARDYVSRKKWRNASHYLVHLAKQRGIYEQCVAHMPKRATRASVIPNEATRVKMAESAKRRAADPVWRANHSKFMRERFEKLKSTGVFARSLETRAKMSLVKTSNRVLRLPTAT